jgi:predicted NACHT family NTPase
MLRAIWSRSPSNCPAIAYVSITLLAADDSDTTGDEDVGVGVSQSFEDLLDELHGKGRRLLVRGEAGSGKSTLLRWASLQAAKPGEDGEAAQGGWRECIPFLIRLRDYPQGKLPSVFELPGEVAKNVGAPPEGWVRELLDSGRALLLFDGVDEVPNDRRDDVRREIEEIIRTYPGNFFLVSTRPAAVPENWLASLDFRESRINPMSEADRNRFIEKWHTSPTRKRGNHGSSSLARRASVTTHS